jgi:hypothetical protein
VKIWIYWCWWEVAKKAVYDFTEIRGKDPDCEIQYVIDMQLHWIEGAQGWGMGGTTGRKLRKTGFVNSFIKKCFYPFP